MEVSVAVHETIVADADQAVNGRGVFDAAVEKNKKVKKNCQNY